MKPLPSEAVAADISQFDIEGDLEDVCVLDRGHIHNTFISTWRTGSLTERFLHQQLNDKVFTNIPALMHNVKTVTRYLKRVAREGSEREALQTLELVRTRFGKSFLVTENGHWRTYNYVENTETFDRCSGTDQAYQAALAFGDFQAQLTDLEVGELRETIPHFFSSPFRILQFEDALASDPQTRAGGTAEEIQFVLARRKMAYVMESHLGQGSFPLRIVHGDTKLNNVLFDRDTGKAVCIVDLDTCMPAYSLYDFGDLVRFTAATSKEDETEMAEVGTDLEVYRALVDGYLERAGPFLTPLEVELMPFAARLVTFTIGLRFLTDYLAGDVYFRVRHPLQNLQRARVQFRMVAFMEQHEEQMAVR